MPFFHVVILALVQGITEFLPISSSGHLVLVHAALGETEDDLTLDIAVHVGTLFAVLLYFRRDICRMIGGLKPGAADRNMLAALIIASLPVVIAGFVLHITGPEWTRSLTLLAWSTLIFGVLLWAADQFRPMDRTLDKLTLKDAALIGLAQAIALIPGVSRSGITMTAGRALGFSRSESARFSLLLAVVAISGAGILGGLDLMEKGDMNLSYTALVAAVLAFVSALVTIALMMRWLDKASFTPFAVYRVIMGFVMLGLIYGGVLAP